MKKKLTLSITVLGLLLLGAACGKSTTSTNTNTVTPTNSTSNTNEPSRIFSTASVETTNTNSPVGAQTVTISASGVSPATLTVRSGTVVTFQNNDTVSHQIASNPHPVHTDLPGFERLIAPGATYTFTFSKVGSWGYHDHLDFTNSRWTGRVIVQ